MCVCTDVLTHAYNQWLFTSCRRSHWCKLRCTVTTSVSLWILQHNNTATDSTFWEMSLQIHVYHHRGVVLTALYLKCSSNVSQTNSHSGRFSSNVVRVSGCRQTAGLNTGWVGYDSTVRDWTFNRVNTVVQFNTTTEQNNTSETLNTGDSVHQLNMDSFVDLLPSCCVGSHWISSKNGMLPIIFPEIN